MVFVSRDLSVDFANLEVKMISRGVNLALLNQPTP